MDMPKLMPCPFCGGEAELNNTDLIASVRCRFCGAATRLIVKYPIDERDHVEVAVKGWNRRWKGDTERTDS